MGFAVAESAAHPWGAMARPQVPQVGMNASRILCRLADIPEGGAIAVDVDSAMGGFSLVLLREGETVHAYHNECPHAGRRLDWAPGRFLVKGGQIVCAAHGATFAVATGTCLGGPCRNGLARMPVQVIDGEVCLA